MAKFLDVFLSAVAIFFLAFAWIYHYLKNTTASLLGAVVFALCGGWLVFGILTSKQRKTHQKRAKKQQLTALFDYLCYHNDLCQVMLQMAKYYRFQAQKICDDHIVATKENNIVQLGFCFENTSLTNGEARKQIVQAKNNHAQKLILFCNGATAQVKTTAQEHFNVQFVDINNLFALLEQCNQLPTLANAKSKKSSYFLQYALCKKRFRAYFAGGFFLLLTSALTFFPLYSIVWATALFGVAFYSLLNKKYNTQPTAVTLD